MRRSLAVAALIVALPAALYAAPAVSDAVAALNQEIVRLLEPFQNDRTQASLVFSSLEIDEVRARSVAARARVWKIGPANEFTLSLDDLSYSYGDGTRPVTHVKARLAFDILKVIPQQDVNELGSILDELVESWASEFASEYGEAATVDARITDRKTDEAGNLQSVSMVLAARIDLSQLPADRPKEEVLFTEAAVAVDFNLQGAAFEVTLVSNPAYKGFAEDQKGLKEELEKLLARDPETLGELTELIEGLNGMAEWIVSPREPEPQPEPQPEPAPEPTSVN